MIDVEIRDHVLEIVLDNPPVNAFGAALRQDVDRAVAEAQADPAIRAIVIRGVGRLFSGGADISEFGQGPVEPWLPLLVDRIAAEDDLAAAALAFAAEIAGDGPRRTGDREAIAGPGLLERFAQDHARRVKGLDAPAAVSKRSGRRPHCRRTRARAGRDPFLKLLGGTARADLAGVDIGWHRDPTRIESLRDVLCAEGRWGQKPPAGLYDYDDRHRPTPSLIVAGIIDTFRAEAGIIPRAITDKEIVARTLDTTISELR